MWIITGIALAVPVSVHFTRFCGEIRKIIFWKLLLPRIKKCICLFFFYTPPHDSDGVLWFQVGRLSVHLSVHPYFCFQMITWVNINGFLPNLVCALTLCRSCFRLQLDKFYRVLTELPAWDMPVFSFPGDNLSKYQWIFAKLGMYIDIIEI